MLCVFFPAASKTRMYDETSPEFPFGTDTVNLSHNEIILYNLGMCVQVSQLYFLTVSLEY